MEHNKVDTELQDSYDDQEKWVLDSSTDSRGKIPLRSRTGAWRAALFIIGIEFSERLSYFGISTNLVVYLTTILHQDLKMAVKNANYWSGVTALMPLLGGFIADAYLGRYATVLLATTVYLMGLILLTLSWFIPGLKPCHENMCVEPRKAHEIAFFIAIYLIAIGTGGHKPSLESFGADQFEDGHSQERKMKMSYFNWWNAGLCAGIFTAVTVIVYVEDQIGWGVAGIILTIVMATSFIIFLIGKPFYRYRAPSGSPLTPMLQVLVAAIAKRHLSCPSDSSFLHELTKEECTKGRLLSSTKSLKYLDKAAVIEDQNENTTTAEKQSTWRLATVTKVEEVKLLINMIPIWFFTLAFGVCATQSGTLFIKQAMIMDRQIIGTNFIVPPASLFSLVALSIIITVTIYERVLVPLLIRATGNERGISILQRIGTGMVFSLIAMIIAALVEKKRLDYAKEHHMSKTMTLSAIWLAPQFIVLGIADAFTLVGLQEYFYDQVPDSMRSLGIAFYLSVLGSASFANNLLITVSDHLAEEISGKGWFGKDLNSSRLDRFYWMLAALTGANMCFFVMVAMKYTYKSVQPSLAVVADRGDDDDVETATGTNNTSKFT
ncbi:PREDICTED: protein NRT1/ PTR FAMILY 5.7-like [Camelina sativa]|uniref:Protein NRT1/ PTR FAMILY 5.7-like n=1 Tax=Camelina sativa TaxID=90675 RepID=A0ABM0YPX1_CAMSA|nr:PREDICTED: protein NRT1/ PTR FAMILY 5.7-like [Camelina sativa]